MFFQKSPTLFISTIFFMAISYCATLQAAERRRIYLNGVDISGAKHQDLSDVNISIDGQGHIFIEAPHYEVIEESQYIPLSSNFKAKSTRPMHKPAGPLTHKNSLPDRQNLKAPLSPANPLMEKNESLDKTGNKEPNIERKGEN